MAKTSLLDPSLLPGTFRSRVFVGGSYKVSPAAALKVPPRKLLEILCKAVRDAGLHPIAADAYVVAEPERDIHHDAIYLLHACRCAIFELSEFSGALMEIERSVDFGTQCLVLHSDPNKDGLRLSRMLSSFVLEHHSRIRLYGYNDNKEAGNAARNWLDEMLRLKHARH
jgi:hypothetical protein